MLLHFLKKKPVGHKPVYKKRVLLSLFLAALLFTVSLAGLRLRSSPLYIAAVGPMSGPSQLSGEQMVQGINLYLQDLNHQGGIDGHPVKLMVFDDQNDQTQAKEQAQRIVGDRRILAVLGHYYSSTSIAAGEIYDAANIPVISGSATAEGVTADRPSSFRTIFSNSVQGSFLANYLHHILGEEQVSIIYTPDNYGESLANAFVNAFRGLEGEVASQWQLNVESEAARVASEAEIIDDLLQQKLEGKAPKAIFLATHEAEAVPLLVALKRNNLTPLLLGPDALGQEPLGQAFSSYPEEQAEPGYFSNGLHAVAPIIFDVANAEAQEFRQEFSDRYSQDPSWNAATYHDAAQVTTTAIQQALQGETLDPKGRINDQRAALRTALGQINAPSKAVKGLQGEIYFDNQGNSLQSTPIGVFHNQRLVPALRQLQPITDLRQTSGLETALKTGQVLQFNNRYMDQVNVVYTGIDINDVDELNAKDSSYLMDFYLWFRYRGNLDAESIEFTNLVDSLQLQEELGRTDKDDQHYRAYRIKGRFRSDFDFRDYPFDEQSLRVSFRHKDLRVEDLLYVNDVVGMRSNSTAEILDKLRSSKVLDSLPNWSIKTAKFFQDTLQDDSTLGNPEFLDPQYDDSIRYSRFNAVVTLKRDSLGFVVKNLLPVFLLIAAAYMLLFIPSDGIAPKAGGGLSILLATSFFHVRLSNDLPVVGYLVAIEYIFFGMYVLCLFALFISISTNIAAKRKNERVHDRLDRLGKQLYPSLLSGFILGFALVYVVHPLWQEKRLANPQPVLAASPASVEITAQPAAPVSLNLGSWRTDDVPQLNRILQQFEAEHPNIDVNFTPTKNLSYQTILEEQLQEAAGPDLFYVPPFSEEMAQKGYLTPLGELPNIDAVALQRTYPAALRSPWEDKDGNLYALPMMAVSHGIYYNADLFQQLNLDIPQTWEELLQAAAVIQQAGYIPFANGTTEKVLEAETVLMNLAPNFIGGREGRLAYLKGDRCFDDPKAIAAFQALADLRPYLANGLNIETEQGSRQLFVEHKAAMMFNGSWQISQLEAAKPEFEWGIFGVPAPQGQPSYVNFHPDFAIGVNPHSAHPDEVQTVLTWLSQTSTAQQFVDELPGFFPLNPEVKTATNQYANQFLQLNADRETDLRWGAEQLREGLPDGYMLMADGAMGVLQNKLTPKQAAEQLQKGLSQWFEPAQTCRAQTQATSPVGVGLSDPSKL